jgi:hypothetical protein
MNTGTLGELQIPLSPQLIIEAAKRAGKTLGTDFTVGQFVDAVWKFGRGYIEGVFPRHIVEFICRYITDACPKSILDPWAKFGVLLIPLATVTSAAKAVGITPNVTDLEIAKALDTRETISWILGDPLQQVDSIKESFDLVASFPPFNFGGTRQVRIDLNGATVEVSDNVSNILILKSLFKLTDNGTGIS